MPEIRRKKPRAAAKKPKQTKALVRDLLNNQDMDWRLRQHFVSLGFLRQRYGGEKYTDSEVGQAITNYKDWCFTHGFSQTLNKSMRQLRDEASHVASRRAESVLAEAKRNASINPQEAIEAVFSGQSGISPYRLPKSLRNLEAAYTIVKTNAAATRKLKELILYLHDVCPEVLEDPVLDKNFAVTGLAYIALYHDFWLRPITTWKPKSHNTYRRFRSVVQHLLCDYAVPPFMDRVWFNSAWLSEQGWYVDLGQGRNLTTCKLPIPYTKKMAHHFLQAPDNYNVKQAIRWGQIRALGGQPRLANAIAPTFLCTSFNNGSTVLDNREEFWLSVIRWFIGQPMLDMDHVGPILDYIQNQKYTIRTIFEQGVGRIAPPEQPHFTMKNRNPETLLRQVEAWHKKLGKETRHGTQTWAPSGLPSMLWEEGQGNNQRIYTITELLSTAQLRSEGQLMHHCVGSYSGSCSSGRVSIWTLDESGRENWKWATISVNNQSKSITEVRGKNNCRVNQKIANLVKKWSVQAGLQASSYAL